MKGGGDVGGESSTADRSRRPEVHIRPPHGLGLGNIAEIVHHRQLVRSMAWRRVRARFDNLYLGVFWTVARPLLMTFVFVFIKHVSEAKMGSGVPYAAFLFSGLVLWFYLAGSINETARALERDAGLVQKVYFPRLVSPVAPMFANLVEIAIGALVVLAMMFYFDLWPGWRFALLPLVLLQTMAMILGVGLVFAALNLVSRDWNQLLGLILYIGLFMSPVLYGPERIPEAVRGIYYLNPAAGTLMALRSCLFDPMPFPVGQWAYSVGFSLAVLLLGLFLFRRVEHRLLDQL